jgi:hypothetical protein
MKAQFDELMREVMTDADRFGHRQHVQLSWLAVRRHGREAAIDIVSDGIRETATYARRPQKYHATVSRAWVELVAHHVDELPGAGFEEYLVRNPALLDKRLLIRFYSSRKLASTPARTGWVEPDVAPFPWRRLSSR